MHMLRIGRLKCSERKIVTPCQNRVQIEKNMEVKTNNTKQIIQYCTKAQKEVVKTALFKHKSLGSDVIENISY